MKPNAPPTAAGSGASSIPVPPDGSQFPHLPLGVPQLVPQPWDVESILQNQANAYGPPRIPILTIYMQDFRTDTPDHLLAELPIPLQKDVNEQLWVNADEMVRKLQGTPGRIDGMAKLSIKRGIYRQLFCRLSTTSIEKCHPENLRVSNEHSLEIVIEPINHAPPPPPPPLTATSSSSSVTNKRGQSEDDATITDSPGSARNKRRKLPASPNDMDSPESSRAGAASNAYGTPSFGLGIQPQGFLSNNNSVVVQAKQSPITSPSAPSARPKLVDSKSISDAKAADAKRNAKNEMAKSIIVPWLRSMIEQEDGYEAFAKSKGRILTIAEALRGYRFARNMIQKYNNMQSPPDLEGAGNRKVTKVNIWQALDRQTSWGSDAETTLALVEKYGPGQPEEHPKIVEMMNGQWGPEEREGSVLFLNHLKRIDAEHKAAREAAAAAAIAVVSATGMG